MTTIGLNDCEVSEWVKKLLAANKVDIDVREVRRVILDIPHDDVVTLHVEQYANKAAFGLPVCGGLRVIRAPERPQPSVHCQSVKGEPWLCLIDRRDGQSPENVGTVTEFRRGSVECPSKDGVHAEFRPSPYVTYTVMPPGENPPEPVDRCPEPTPPPPKPPAIDPTTPVVLCARCSHWNMAEDGVWRCELGLSAPAESGCVELRCRRPDQPAEHPPEPDVLTHAERLEICEDCLLHPDVHHTCPYPDGLPSNTRCDEFVGKWDDRDD